MAETFVTGTGSTISIGRELGRGGEGTVYEVLSDQRAVAKLYNAQHMPDALKQDKLRFMAASADQELLSYAAWPQDTLHKTHGGPVIGFLMPKISGCAPIHMLYSPAHRRQDYPQAAWDFLLFAARNTAAAFAAIHSHGHVVGDVNQGNLLVMADSKVVLIDTDSFQIDANGTVHLCQVGVSHFTPPELHGVPFDRVARTSNHDNFGLALLVFHLLFGGRHPYSGVPLRDDVGVALEKDIQSFRYAYALDAQQRGFMPPPKSIPVAIVPGSIQTMFTAAFTEKGRDVGRPTAQQWVTALNNVRGQLKRCGITPMHVHPGHLDRCPWCALEKQGLVYFLDVQVHPMGVPGFSLANVWAKIEGISAPPDIPVPDIASIAVTPTPLPTSVLGWLLLCAVGVTELIGTFVIVNAFPKNLFLAVLIVYSFVLCSFIVFLGLWELVVKLEPSVFQAEKNKRQMAWDKAQLEYDRIVAQIQRMAEAFHENKQGLAHLRDEYQYLPEHEKTEITNLHVTTEACQKQQFLERCFIDTAPIPGIDPARKAALQSFGIETAADVAWKKVFAVEGFDIDLTRLIMDWRRACERIFVFDPRLAAVTEANKDAVRARIAARMRALETKLNAGAAELQRLRQETVNKANALRPLLQEASLNLAQARADLGVCH